MKSKVWARDKIYSPSLCAFRLEKSPRRAAETLSQNPVCSARRTLNSEFQFLAVERRVRHH